MMRGLRMLYDIEHTKNSKFIFKISTSILCHVHDRYILYFLEYDVARRDVICGTLRYMIHLGHFLHLLEYDVARSDIIVEKACFLVVRSPHKYSTETFLCVLQSYNLSKTQGNIL